MITSRRAAGRGLSGLILLAALAAGRTPAAEEAAAGHPLNNDEKQRIAAAITRCGEIDPDVEKLQANLRTILWAASGRKGSEPGGGGAEMDAATAEAAARDDAVLYVLDFGLGNRAPLSRMISMEALGLMGRAMGPATRKRVLARLNQAVEFDPIYSVRRHAARTVAGFGNGQLLAELYREIPDFDGRLRREVLANDLGQLEELGRTISRSLRRFDTLMALVEGPDQEMRLKACFELQRLTGEYDRFRTEDWRNWWEANRGKLEGRPDSELLSKDVNVTADRSWLLTLIEMAALSNARGATEGLCYVMDHGSVAEQMAAAEALGRLGGAEAVARLRRALGSPDGWVKATAAEALATIDPKGAAADLRKLLDDWEPRNSSPEHRTALVRVRRAAIAGLVAAGIRDAAPRLAALLGEPDSSRYLGWELVGALGRLGGTGELAELARHAALCATREREATVKAIAEICRREPPPAALAGRGLAAAEPAELEALVAGRDAPAGLAAAYELDRRGLLGTGRDGLTGALDRAGSRPARMLCLALLAGRGWSPAVAGMGRAALAAGKDPELARAACAAAAEVGGRETLTAWLGRNSGERGAPSRQTLEGLRREAAVSLAELVAEPTLAPATIAACSEGLTALASGGDPELQGRAVASLMSVLRSGRAEGSVAPVCATLRRLTGEDFSDDPRYWLRWWESRGAGAAGGEGH